MAEFAKALEINREEFIAARLEKLRAVAVKKAGLGDAYFLARQHAYFLLVYRDCKCEAHGCGGCAITLAIASQLETDIAHLDTLRCDQEEAKACTFWTRKWDELRRFLAEVQARFEEMEQRRKNQSAMTRARSLAADRRADAQ